MTGIERLQQQIVEAKLVAASCRDSRATPRIQAITRNLEEVLASFKRAVGRKAAGEVAA